MGGGYKQTDAGQWVRGQKRIGGRSEQNEKFSGAELCRTSFLHNMLCQMIQLLNYVEQGGPGALNISLVTIGNLLSIFEWLGLITVRVSCPRKYSV